MIRNDLSISDILRALASHIVVILISALICGMAAFGITKTFIKPMYNASITLYAVSNVNQDANIISIGEQNASTQLASTYALILRSNSVLQAVSEELKNQGLLYSSGQLRGMVRTATTETQVFSVGVTAGNAADAKAIADTIANVAATRIVEIVGSGEVRIVDYAQLPRVPSSPNIPSNTTVGVVIGLLLACAFVIIRLLTDSTIWTEEDIAKQIDVPILGTVPQLMNSENETKSKE